MADASAAVVRGEGLPLMEAVQLGLLTAVSAIKARADHEGNDPVADAEAARYTRLDELAYEWRK